MDGFMSKLVNRASVIGVFLCVMMSVWCVPEASARRVSLTFRGTVKSHSQLSMEE